MTIHRKNYYEELIDKMMLDGITGLTEDIKAEITKFPTHKKRLTILNLLEENDISHRKLFSSILSIMKENDVTETEHIKQVVTKLREYVEVGAVEKKKYGEVMTPITLVEEMLDTLPNEVWSNPDLKWLDSCCGVGIFPSVIVERLMAGLANIIPDDEARYTHIVENMLHVGELQPKNMFLFLCAFDPEDKYDMNIYTGTYLDEGFDQHMKEVFGVEKFDVITINPPYNSGSENSGSAHTLWDKFITKSLECSLVEGGYLVAVHPDGWRNLGNGFKDVKNLLKSKEMIYLELHNTNDGYKTFGAYTTYDFYCVRNTNNNNFLTKVKFMDGISKMLNVSSMDFIPNGMIKSFEKLIAKEGEERVDLVRSCKYHTQKDFVLAETDETHKHPLVYTTAKDGSIKFRYSSINNLGGFGTPKVIWSNGGATTPIIDDNGIYGTTEFAYYIADDVENLPKIKAAMESPEFNKLISFSDGVTGVGRHRYNHKAIALFRKDFWKEFI